MSTKILRLHAWMAGFYKDGGAAALHGLLILLS